MSAFDKWAESDDGPDLSVFGSLEKYWLREAYNAALEAAALACMGERVDADATREGGDEAYNLACVHCFEAINAIRTAK